jgi:hypothetical protein
VCALFLLWLAVAPAQSLDLRLQPVIGGTVTAIREVGATPQDVPRAAGTQQVGVPSDIERKLPVGAVVYLPLGPQSDKNWRFGAAGTPEMQAQLAQSTHEIVVTMDDGERRVFRPHDARRFSVGQRVSVRAGQVEPLPKEGT